MTIEDIFLATVEKPPAERAAYLDAACGPDAGLRAAVEALLRAHEEAGSLLEQPLFRPAPTVDLPPVTEGPGTAIGPYKLLEQIGEGGFGVVFMAEQTHPVRRKVALKVLKPGMDSRQVVARFEAERQALAIMDHPNIARVFDGGATPSGRPYFVMELVKGVPITDFCDQNHLTPRQRLELFLSVCQAVQHAHQKGIIHRDIKPSNVLVTVHDTTPVVKVIDFGVAKALGQVLTEKTLFTAFAQMVGTPLYMSPEQAGQSGLDVDTRSDIYSLGVLLYELLTGTTPFDKDRFKTAAYDEIRRIIREEEPPKPSTRLSDLSRSGEPGRSGTVTSPTAPTSSLASISAQRHTEPGKLTRLFRGEVDWIVMKALEKDRNRRYETANGFAADVQRYLADEPVQACPPSAAYRLRKFARRNRRGLATAAVLAVAVLVVAGTLGWAVRDRVANAQEAARERAARQTAVEQEVTLALKEAEQLRGQEKWPEALSAAKRAEGLLAGGGSDELRDRVRQLRKDLDMVMRLEDIRIRMSGVQTERVFNFEVADREYGKAFADHAIEIDCLSTSEAAERIRKGTVAVQLAAAINDWAMARRSSPMDETQWKHLLAVAKAADPDEWRNQFRDAWERRDTAALSKLAAGEKIPNLSAATLYLLGSALRETGAAQEAFALLRQAHDRHPDDFWINLELAYCCLYSLSPPRVDDAIRFLTAAKAIRKDNPAPDRYLGRAFLDKGALDESIAASRQAIQLKPDWYPPYVNLGAALLRKGQLDESIAASRQAIQLIPGYATPRINLGIGLERQGKLDEAIDAYRKAIELDPKLALAHTNLGIALRDQGKLDEAVASHRKAIELDPNSVWAHNNLGITLNHQKKLDEAIACYKKAIELDPKYAPAHSNLGIAFGSQGKLDEAVASHRKAIELDPKLANAHNGLGNALMAQKKIDEAIACYKEAIELDPRFAMPHYNLGNVLADQKKPDEAVACYKKAIELDPKYAPAHYNLGVALKAQGKPDEAIASYRKAIELDPKLANAHIALGNVLSNQKKLDEAVASYRKAIEVDPKCVRAHTNLGYVLLEQGRPDEAIASCRTAIELDPKDAAAHCTLGGALCQKGRFDDAIASCQTAIDLDPKDAVARYNLGCALRGKRQFDEAIASFRKVVELDPKFASGHHNLGESLWWKGRPAEAVDCFRKAIELDPKNTGSHYMLGTALRNLGREEEAIASFRKAIEVDPSHRGAHMTLAGILQTKGEVDLALTHYRKAAEGNKAPANKTLPYFWLAGGFQGQGNWDQAVASYKKAIELDPTNFTFHIGLGKALESQGKAAEAIACYRRAVEVDPKNVGALNTLAWALATCADRKLRDTASALRHAETGVELLPKYAPGWQTLAWARYRTDDWKGAVAAMTKVTELGSKGDSIEWFLLAMAHWKLGDKAEARMWYDKAVEWMEKNQPMNEELRRFRAEASELLGVAVEVAPPPRQKK